MTKKEEFITELWKGCPIVSIENREHIGDTIFTVLKNVIFGGMHQKWLGLAKKLNKFGAMGINYVGMVHAENVDVIFFQLFKKKEDKNPVQVLAIRLGVVGGNNIISGEVED